VGGWVENILHTVDKRGSGAKLGFLGKPGFIESDYSIGRHKESRA